MARRAKAVMKRFRLNVETKDKSTMNYGFNEKKLEHEPQPVGKAMSDITDIMQYFYDDKDPRQLIDAKGTKACLQAGELLVELFEDGTLETLAERLEGEGHRHDTLKRLVTKTKTIRTLPSQAG